MNTTRITSAAINPEEERKGGAGNPGSMEKMVRRIIDNLQIKIKNVYVRCEDNFSCPSSN
jgi:ERCC4-related helicase